MERLGGLRPDCPGSSPRITSLIPVYSRVFVCFHCLALLLQFLALGLLLWRDRQKKPSCESNSVINRNSGSVRISGNVKLRLDLRGCPLWQHSLLALTVQGDSLTSQDRIWRMACILPASESGGKASLAEVSIPFPVCSVSGDWKTLCNKRREKNK